MLKKLKLLKKPLFQTRRWSCDFPPRKDGILYPRRVVLGLPSPSHRVCADVRTYGHVTITSQPKFLGLIGYQISLAMELRWRALPAGSAINHPRIIIFEAFLPFRLDVERSYQAKNNRRFARVVCWGLSTHLFAIGYALRMRGVYAYAANECNPHVTAPYSVSYYIRTCAFECTYLLALHVSGRRMRGII